jgi:hypothetical protein
MARIVVKTVQQQQPGQNSTCPGLFVSRRRSYPIQATHKPLGNPSALPVKVRLPVEGSPRKTAPNNLAPLPPGCKRRATKLSTPRIDPTGPRATRPLPLPSCVLYTVHEPKPNEDSMKKHPGNGGNGSTKLYITHQEMGGWVLTCPHFMVQAL